MGNSKNFKASQRINKVIEISITKVEGNTALIRGLKSKLNANALAILDSISNDNASATPKNIFLPSEESLSEPNINNIENNNIAIRVIGLIMRLYNSTSKALAARLLFVKKLICLYRFQVDSSCGSFLRMAINS